MYKNTSKNNYLSTPNKIFEYMLAGIPTVASNHPGKSYVIEKEQTGVCVEETPEAIKDGIERVVVNYNFYKEHCLQKRHLYTWEVEGKKLVELYAENL